MHLKEALLRKTAAPGTAIGRGPGVNPANIRKAFAKPKEAPKVGPVSHRLSDSTNPVDRLRYLGRSLFSKDYWPVEQEGAYSKLGEGMKYETSIRNKMRDAVGKATKPATYDPNSLRTVMHNYLFGARRPEGVPEVLIGKGGKPKATSYGSKGLRQYLFGDHEATVSAPHFAVGGRGRVVRNNEYATPKQFPEPAVVRGAREQVGQEYEADEAKDKATGAKLDKLRNWVEKLIAQGKGESTYKDHTGRKTMVKRKGRAADPTAPKKYE